MSIIGVPFGWVMRGIYLLIHNYGLVLIAFTIFFRLLMFPMNIRQQKNMARNQLMQPKMDKLKKKYGKDKQRYQEEMMKLQQEEGMNPMSSCLPLILQMVLLFGIIDVVYKPLKHLLRVSTDLITEATDLLLEAGFTRTNMVELEIMNIIQGTNSEYSATMFDSIFSGEIIAEIQNFQFNFLGLNLSQTPSWGWNLTIIIPLLSGLTSLLMTFITMRHQKNSGMQQGGGMMNGIMYLMPVFSTWIAFSFPLGIGMYWTVGNVCSIVANLVCYRLYTPEKMKKIVEEEKKKPKKKSRYQEALERAREQQAQQAGTSRKVQTTARDVTDDGDNEDKADESGLTQNQRIALARKRMAEKYGDDY